MNVKSVLFITVLTAVGLLVFYDGSVTVFESKSVANAVPSPSDRNSEQIMTQWSENDSKIAYEKLVQSPPEYLNGTDLRGAFPVDENNQLIIHRKIKQRFDYFFLMSSDLSHDEIVAIIRGNIYSELKGEAQQQALSLLENYSLYLIQYNHLISRNGASHVSGLSQNDLQHLLNDIQSLRISVLGEQVANVFFAQESWLQTQSIGLVRGESDSASPYEQSIMENQAKTLIYESKKEKLKNLLGNEPSPEELRALRVQEYGEAATVRLEALDASRKAFKDNLREVKSIHEQQQNNGLSDQENRAALIEHMGQKGLSVSEVNRLLVVANINE